MVNYGNGKIYKIEPIVDHEEEEIYIGSTTKQYLSQRMSDHRESYKKWLKTNTSKCTSFLLFDKYGAEKCTIVLLEAINASSKDELQAREKHFIQSLKCVNKYIPLRSNKEYYLENKIYLDEYYKKFREDNKLNKREYDKKYREKNSEKLRNLRRLKLENKHTCECGSIINNSKLSRHIKTNKHRKFLDSKINI